MTIIFGFRILERAINSEIDILPITYNNTCDGIGGRGGNVFWFRGLARKAVICRRHERFFNSGNYKCAAATVVVVRFVVYDGRRRSDCRRVYHRHSFLVFALFGNRNHVGSLVGFPFVFFVPGLS